ncbi:MAG: creatininase family protein [Bacteroidota bacterium]
MQSSRPYILAETNWRVVLDTDYQVAVLPWGATEAHNYHMPYATDNYQVDFVAAASAKIAWEAGTKVIVLPCIPFGINSGQMDVKLCMNINPSTQLAILKDTVDVLRRHGIHKLVILNGHGGNSFKAMIRELSVLYPDVFVAWANWYKAVDWNLYFNEPGDHAGEMETSAMLHIAPGLVEDLAKAGPGKAKQYKVKALRENWVTAQRQWTQVTEDTGVGNPAKATAEKGKIYLDASAAKIADFLIELAATPLDDFYE